MELKPILQVLWRGRTGPVLLMLQIAITVAVLVNAFTIVQDRLDRLARPTGIDHENQFVIGVSVFRRGENVLGQVPLDLEAIRALPGVVAASPINSTPASGGGMSATLRVNPELDTGPQAQSSIYLVDEHGLDALGARLVAGRNFEAEEVQYPTQVLVEPLRPPVALVTRAFADALFEDGDALGQTVYYSTDTPVQVVGILERLVGPDVDRSDTWERTIVFPVVTSGSQVLYLVRTEPGMRDALMTQVEQLLGERDPERVIGRLSSQEALMARAYERHRGTSIVLVGISGMLLAINALGVVGLASFLVNRRRRQIGTRRALGATRFDICRYFMTEIAFIAAGGLAGGFVLTLIGSNFLSQTLELPPVEAGAIAISAGVILLLTQLAVLGPALRAASIPPALATRAV